MWHIKVFKLKILPFLLLLLLLLFVLLNQNICLGEISRIENSKTGNFSAFNNFEGGSGSNANQIMVVGDIVVGTTTAQEDNSTSRNVPREPFKLQQLAAAGSGDSREDDVDDIENLVDYHRKWQIGLTPAAMEYQIRINNNKKQDNNSNNNNNKHQCQQHNKERQNDEKFLDDDDDDKIDENAEHNMKAIDSKVITRHRHHKANHQSQRHQGHLQHGQQQHLYKRMQHDASQQHDKLLYQQEYSLENLKEFETQKNHHQHHHSKDKHHNVNYQNHHQQHRSKQHYSTQHHSKQHHDKQHHQHHLQQPEPYHSSTAKHKHQPQLPLEVIKLKQATLDNWQHNEASQQQRLAIKKNSKDFSHTNYYTINLAEEAKSIGGDSFNFRQTEMPAEANYQSDDNFEAIWQNEELNQDAAAAVNQREVQQPKYYENLKFVDVKEDDFFFEQGRHHSQHSHHHKHHTKSAHFPPTFALHNLANLTHNELHGAAARSGRHRARVVINNNSQLAQQHLAADLLASPTSYSSKVFRSLPDSENDSYHHHMQRLLHLQPAQRYWPVKHEAIVEGDVILGGLMMVHSREDTITCGPIMPQGGIQSLEAMLYTIDRINEAQFLPNITLGAHILDDCDKDSYGLEMAVDFIKGKWRIKSLGM